MEPNTIFSWLTPLVGTVTAYLKNRKKPDEGSTIAEETLRLGQKLLGILQTHMTPDATARQALANMEIDPEEDLYQQKLTKEILRLAQANSSFASKLQELSGAASDQQATTTNTFVNKGSNKGFQGSVQGSVTLYLGQKEEQKHD